MFFCRKSSITVFLFVFIILKSKTLIIEAIATNQTSLNTNSYAEFPACKIYCHGELLHLVQMSKIFKDSKTFVDLKLKYSPNETIQKFNKFMEERRRRNVKPIKEEIDLFVKINFEDSSKEFIKWIPNDWTENPRFLDLIRNSEFKQWGKDLHNIWKTLGRKINDDVYKNPDYYSLIPVPNPIIIPGGRFIEYYYWDSYWIILGLLQSEMYSTARGMLSNYLYLVKRFGFIPNGGRIYYARRSQLPLLAVMIKSYVDATNDYQFAMDSVDVLEKEFDYWVKYHLIFVNGNYLFRYNSLSTSPRPESYREDFENAEIFPTLNEKENFYSETATTAESGIDFSSRWFIDWNGTNKGNITNTKTRSIIPVELNAIMYKNAKIIEEFYSMSHDLSHFYKSLKYKFWSEYIFLGIQNVLWNEEVGVWLDYDIKNKRSRNYFVPTNLAPLWTYAFKISDSEKISKTVLKYIDTLQLDKYPGGVPFSLQQTGEQWDLPNAWPPMQYILVEGLANLGTPEAKKLSKSWGYRWIQSNFEAYRKSHFMFEKYDATVFGGHRESDGEYKIQTGFGWTNGIIIEYLAKYGENITPVYKTNNEATSIKELVSTIVIALSFWKCFGQLYK